MGNAIDSEFDRQLNVLLSKGYPGLAGLSAQRFCELVDPLRPVARSTVPDGDLAMTPSRVSFVLVVSELLVRADDVVPLTRLVGGSAPGVVDRNHGPEGLAPYRPLADLEVPEAPVYLLVDVERGEEFCGVRPVDALPTIRGRGRTPLTIHEGVALVTQFPPVLEKNRCFMLAGSRRGDRRVPAIWISGKEPKLGWCWEGNPHTWLGMASAGSRAA
jgi:hypothetical protein